MANTFAPFGFQPTGIMSATPNFRLTQRRAASTAGAMYKGDAVVPVTGTANGYIKQATASTVAMAGVFWGCEYLSTSQKRPVWSSYWPGSDATGDVICYVIDDPNARFVVQASSASSYVTGNTSTWTSSVIGQLCQLNVGTGSTTTGLSGMYIDTFGTTSTYPFQVVDLVSSPPGANGADITSAYNYLVVAFNNELLRSNGALTGIS